MNLFGLLGGLSGFVAVAAGAFGAHALRTQLAPELMAIFDTGARYQLIHALALVLVALLPATRATAISGWAFVAGTVIFSGSLYVLALTGVRTWGAVTPVGGLGFLLGWAALAVSFARR